MTRLLLCFITNLLIISLHAQEPRPISFVHIGLNEGLSQSTVFGITQDKQGNLWFATNNGLNKYNGYEFTVYQHDEQNEHSIGSDIVRTCVADKSGRVWSGTEKGLSLYDADKEIFSNFTYQKNGENLPIRGIAEMNDKQLLLYTDNDLLIFNTETKDFSDNSLPASLRSVSPTAICKQDDNIYIGSQDGVYIYSVSQNTQKSFMPEKLKGIHILSILQQSPTRLWIGTEGDGLFLVNPQTLEVTHYTAGKKGSISSDYVRSLALDSYKQLWVGTIHSLNIYNEADDTFSIYASDPMESGSLSQTSVRNIFMDSQGGMWLGTYFGGLNYYHPLKNRFRNIQFIPHRNSLNNNVIGCIREDNERNLWIGTNGGGVNHYNPRTGKFTHYTQKEGLGSNDVKTIYIDEDRDIVYIGTHTGGFSILHPRSGKVETFNNKDIKNIYTIEPALDGKFWISAITVLLCYNPQNKAFTIVTTQANGQPLPQNRPVTMLRDSKQRLWTGGEKGIIIYTEKDGGLLNLPLIPAQSSVHRQSVTCIYEAKNGIFWIGTRGGIYRYDENKNETKHYTTAHGLPNNVVHGILEDSYGKLWLSTEKGLSCFQPQTEKFRNYTDYDGIQSNQFTANSHCRTSNGQLYLGGINGITTFVPEQLTDNPYIPPVVITRLKLFNKTVYPNDETGILENSISETRHITLSAKQAMFSLEFVVSNYISGNQNTFAYKLDGYDKEWYYSNSLRTVSYSNLPHGTYRFLVKAANSDGKWNDIPTELGITVLPVWYKTWWAFLLFAIAFLGIVFLIFRYLWIRKSMEARIEMERTDRERQKEMNEMKLRFFINISHELRTPLTLILAPLEEMISKVNDRWMHKQLRHIQQNTNRLLHLVNQLMDYRRAELGVFGLKVKPNNIHQVIEKNFHFYERLAQRKNIQYSFYSELEDKEIICDPGYLELIEHNLLSNAFKYTGEGQSITVVLKEDNDMLLLQVKDTGSGIPVDKQGKIFERFFQVDNEHLGSGIGLSLVQRLTELHHGRIELDSQEGVGSTFSIYLPTDESAYSPDEKSTGTKDEEEQPAYTTNNQDMYIVDTEKTDETENQTSNEELRSECILIVEDNTEILEYLSNELGKTYPILKAGNGAEALEIIKKQKADLILTDVMMPVMDGLQLCKQIKQNLSTCHIPVIILSAKADLKEQLEGLQVGADDYIPKPFSLAVVAAKIRNMLRTRYRAIQHYSNSLEIEPEKIALNPLDEELLKKAVDVVERHMDDIEFSTEVFAREMYMSRSNLHLKMKVLTGESTNEFIRKIRFNQACKLLKEERYTVAEISTMVGFNTPSYFATSFKKYFGCLPSEYAKNGGMQQN